MSLLRRAAHAVGEAAKVTGFVVWLFVDDALNRERPE